MQLFPQNPLPAPHRPTGLQIITGNYRLTTAHYRQITDIHMTYYKGYLPLPAIYRQRWSIYRRLPPVMKYYRHVGNAVMKSCTSNVNPRKRTTRNNVYGKTKLHILHFNTNGIGAADKRAEIIRYTEEHDVDILCLQETSLGISKKLLALQDGKRRAEQTENNTEACTAECPTDTEAS